MGSTLIKQNNPSGINSFRVKEISNLIENKLQRANLITEEKIRRIISQEFDFQEFNFTSDELIKIALLKILLLKRKF